VNLNGRPNSAAARDEGQPGRGFHGGTGGLEQPSLEIRQHIHLARLARQRIELKRQAGLRQALQRPGKSPVGSPLHPLGTWKRQSEFRDGASQRDQGAELVGFERIEPIDDHQRHILKQLGGLVQGGARVGVEVLGVHPSRGSEAEVIGTLNARQLAQPPGCLSTGRFQLVRGDPGLIQLGDRPGHGIKETGPLADRPVVHQVAPHVERVDGLAQHQA
jgi:hypothetical protein